MRFRKVLCRVVTGILFRVRRKRNPSAYAFAARAFSEYSHEANQVNNLVIIGPKIGSGTMVRFHRGRLHSDNRAAHRKGTGLARPWYGGPSGLPPSGCRCSSWPSEP